MKKRVKIIATIMPVLIIIITLFIGCKEKDENENEWKNCYECTAESWVGNFYGTGDYTKLSDPLNVYDKAVSIKIEETAPEYLIVYLSCPGFISATISGSLVSNYVISFAGSGTSMTANLDIRDNDLKLSGTLKKFHMQADSTITDEFINFETYKE